MTITADQWDGFLDELLVLSYPVELSWWHMELVTWECQMFRAYVLAMVALE